MDTAWLPVYCRLASVSSFTSQKRGQPAGRGWRMNPEPRRPAPEEEEEKEDERRRDAVPRGACMKMCPAREIHDREAQSRLHRFEMLAGTERDRRPKADPARVVKEYSRPAAGKDSTRAGDLRPPAVLQKTVCFLIDDIAASGEYPWTEVYDFLFDRLRSVRQDMVIQRVGGRAGAALLEPAVRFLLYSSYRLCGEPLRRYDPRINHTHLQESLSWLLDCYSAGGEEGEEEEQHPRQEEFQALSLLYNLGSAQAMQHSLELPAHIRSSPSVTLALAINRAFLERNPVRLLRLAGRLDFLQSCALHRHLGACRRDLLLLYSHGHSSRNCRFPLPRLALLLGLDAPLASQLCLAHGLEVTQGAVVFSKASFAEPEAGKIPCSLGHGPLEVKRRELSVPDIIHGYA